MDRIARQFLQALRGRRSQLAFSRRLGYRSNVVAKWEQGRRVPSAFTMLRAADKIGIPVTEALVAFDRRAGQVLRGITERSLAGWLKALRGDQALRDVAARSGLSRYQVARCLSGQTKASLPVFFALVQATTARLPDLVAALVDIEQVPLLLREYRDLEAARRCVYRYPWSAVLLALIEADGDTSAPTHADRVRQWQRRLRIDEPTLRRSLAALQEAGIVRQVAGRLQIDRSFVADTSRSPEDAKLLRQHWAQVSADRVKQPGARDLFGHNVFAVSREDYETIRRMQVSFYARVRALVAQSQKSEVAAMLTFHLVSWNAE